MNKYIKLLYEVSLINNRSLKEKSFDPVEVGWYARFYFSDLITGQEVVDNIIAHKRD